MAVAEGRHGKRRRRRGAPAAAAGRQTGCASCPADGAGAAGPTRWSGGCEGWESAEGWGWTSGPLLPQAGTEERWGAKRGEGEKRGVERGGGCEIGEGSEMMEEVRWECCGAGLAGCTGGDHDAEQ